MSWKVSGKNATTISSGAKMRRLGESFAERMERYEREIMEGVRERVRQKQANLAASKELLALRRGKHPYRKVYGGQTWPPVGREKVMMEKQNARCYWCCVDLTGRTFHVDHVLARRHGGSDHPDNLRVSCPRCNLSKCAKPAMDFALRLLS